MKHRRNARANKVGTGYLSRVLPASLLVLGGSSGVLIVLSLALLLASSINAQSAQAIRTGVSDFVAPLLSVISLPIQKTALFVRNVSGLAEIQAENERLAEENVRLREWYQSALLYQAENKSLRDLLNVKIEPGSSYITARILSDTKSAFAKSMLVAAGSEDGVKKGQAVISGEGLVGRVVEVGAEVSRILLISDMNSRVPVLVEHSSQHAMFAGRNETLGRLMHIPVDSEVKPGARLVTSGKGGIFPHGLPVGVVTNVEGKLVDVKPFADFDKMTFIRIVEKPVDHNLIPEEIVPTTIAP